MMLQTTLGHLLFHTLKNQPVQASHPFRCGFALPQGKLGDGRSLYLRDAQDKTQELTLEPLRYWPDGSWQWVLLSGWAEPEWVGQKVEVRLGEDRAKANHATQTTQQDKDWVEAIKSGLFCRFIADKDEPDKDEPFSESTRTQHQDAFAQITELQGGFGARYEPGKMGLHARIHISAYARQPLVRVEIEIWNPAAAKHAQGLWDLGDPASLLFHGLGLRLPRQGKAALQAEPDKPWHELSEGWVLQGSSGSGPSRLEAAHVNAQGQSTFPFSGYRLSDSRAQSEGHRADPVLVWQNVGGGKGGGEDGAGDCAASIEDFWERFPTSMEIETKSIRLEPWPTRNGDAFELQGGEKAHAVIWLYQHNSWDMSHLPEAASAFSAIRAGVYAQPSADSLEQSQALPFFSAITTANASAATPILEAASETSLQNLQLRRDEWDEYGWRHFGEVAADHEAKHYPGQWPMVSHYNNQYDMAYGLLTLGLSRQQPRWMELGLRLTAHVRHHDLYHTRQDKSAYNGGYFWHTAHYAHAGRATHRTYSKWAFEGKALPAGFGGGPSNEHDYSSGFLLHYWLTGDRQSRAAVLQLAEWVSAMQDGRTTPFKWLAGGATGLATCTRDLEWQGPGRGSGYSINTLLDAYLASGNPAWLAKAERVQEIVSSPDDDLDAMGLLDRENRWSYVIYLQMLGRYLEVMRQDNREGPAYARARAVLLHYAHWMAKKEYPYLDKPEELEFPTSTWAAQDLRKAAVFALAARFAPREHYALFAAAAKRFITTATASLAQADDALCTRNQAIAMHCLPVLESFQHAGESWNLGLSELQGPYAPRRIIVPQKILAMQRVKKVIRSGGLLLPVMLVRASRERRDPWA